MIITRSVIKSAILGGFLICSCGGCSSVRQGIWEFASFSDGKIVKGQFEYKWNYYPVRGVVDHTSFSEYAENTKGKGILRVFLEHGKREWLTEMYSDGKQDGMSIVWRPNGKILRVHVMQEGERSEVYDTGGRDSSSIMYYNPSNYTWATFIRYTDGTTSWLSGPER